MARSARSAKLENRTNRLKLGQGKPHFMAIGKGLALGYRRVKNNGGYGTWQARIWDGRAYHYPNLGKADDYQEANGSDILSFYQAQKRAQRFYDEITAGQHASQRDATVQTAAERYVTWYRVHRAAAKATEHVVNVHILPELGPVLLSNLTAAVIRRWHEKLAEKPARIRTPRNAKKQAFRPAPTTTDEKRARKATANRILTVLKAMLNRAFHDGLVGDDTAWRQVKPFGKADEARIRFLHDDEAARLVHAAAPDIRPLIRAALLTGTRYGELVTMRVKDVNKAAARIYIAQSKSGKPRHVPLNSEGAALLTELVANKGVDDLVFTKADGTAWGKNHHVRGLQEACDAAGITPAVRFHELRHTYASFLAQRGIDLLTISKLLGHADTRITARHYAHLADKTLAKAVDHLPSFTSRSGPTVIPLNRTPPTEAAA